MQGYDILIQQTYLNTHVPDHIISAITTNIYQVIISSNTQPHLKFKINSHFLKPNSAGSFSSKTMIENTQNELKTVYKTDMKFIRG